MKVKELVEITHNDIKYFIILNNQNKGEMDRKSLIKDFGNYEIEAIDVSFGGTSLVLSISNKCPSYRVRKEKRLLSSFEQGVYYGKTGKEKTYDYYDRPYCLATKNCENCFCNGDKSRCNFYESLERKVDNDRNRI